MKSDSWVMAGVHGEDVDAFHAQSIDLDPFVAHFSQTCRAMPSTPHWILDGVDIGPVDPGHLYGNHTLLLTWLNETGQLDRDDAPAQTTYRTQDGVRRILVEYWLKDHQPSRSDGGPTTRLWTHFGGDAHVQSELWHSRHTALHNDNGPARINWAGPAAARYVSCKEWRKHGLLERANGPAQMCWSADVDGHPRLIANAWYRNDGYIPPERINELVNRVIRFMRKCRGYRARRQTAVRDAITEAGGVVWPGLVEMIC